MDRLEKKVKLVNKLGLHARPAVNLVKSTTGLNCSVRLRVDDMDVDGRSIMEVLMLGAPFGTEIEVVTEGKHAQECMDRIVQTVETGLGEGIHIEEPKTGIFGKLKGVFGSST